VYHRFPGRAFFEWALILSGNSACVLGFVFLGLFDFAGPLQTFLRATLGQGSVCPTCVLAG
jgi:iron(III) transport system permease protein